MNGFIQLYRIEFRLALRSFDMVIFAIIFPVGIMFLLGLVGADPAQADFCGVASMAILATGLMGLPLTVSDYRHRKILRYYQASPAHPSALLAAQTLTQASFALASAILVLVIACAGFGQAIHQPLRFIGAWLVLLASTYGMGFLVAALAPDAKLAGIACSILYFPLLLLSGTTIPTSVFPALAQDILGALPFSQGIQLLKQAALGTAPGMPGLGHPIPGFLPWTYLSGVGTISYAIAIRHFRWS